MAVAVSSTGFRPRAHSSSSYFVIVVVIRRRTDTLEAAKCFVANGWIGIAVQRRAVAARGFVRAVERGQRMTAIDVRHCQSDLEANGALGVFKRARRISLSEVRVGAVGVGVGVIAIDCDRAAVVFDRGVEFAAPLVRGAEVAVGARVLRIDRQRGLERRDRLIDVAASQMIRGNVHVQLIVPRCELRRLPPVGRGALRLSHLRPGDATQVVQHAHR